jgi:hypothetical protein
VSWRIPWARGPASGSSWAGSAPAVRHGAAVRAGRSPGSIERALASIRAPGRVLLGLVALAAVLPGAAAWAAGERPTTADIARCAEVARAAVEEPAYEERAPGSPLPQRISAIGPYTGPITPSEAQAARAGAAPTGMRSPATSGDFAAGGASQAAASEPGPVDARRRETFDACMRALGF